MKLHRHPEHFLAQLPKAVADLISGAPQAMPFVRDAPSLLALHDYANERRFEQNTRAILTEALVEQNQASKHPEVHAALTSLADPNTFTVTTGHQLNLLGGPAYFVYKIAHTVALARALEKELPGKRIVPVFWMASEDHDFAEIATANTFQSSHSLQQMQGGAVGPMPIANLAEVAEAFVAEIGGMSDETAAFLNSLAKHSTLAEVTRSLVDYLFGKYGVVVLDANDKRLKRLFVPTLRKELIHAPVHAAVSATNSELTAAGYPLQLTVREINVFYLSEGSRDGIIKEGGRYKAGTALDTDETGILELLEASPERFSPNAALRPIYQECILPNLAYIGGPGEMRYWMQLKRSFEALAVDYPILVPRNSVTVFGSKECDWMAALGLTELDLLEPLHELTRRLVLGDAQDDPKIASARQSMADVFESLASYMKTIDPTLEAKAAAAETRVAKELDGLEKSILRTKKQHEEVAVRRLERIHRQAFPAGPQERTINYFAIAALSDEDLIDRLVSDFRPDRGEWLVYLNQ